MTITSNRNKRLKKYIPTAEMLLEVNEIDSTKAGFMLSITLPIENTEEETVNNGFVYFFTLIKYLLQEKTIYGVKRNTTDASILSDKFVFFKTITLTDLSMQDCEDKFQEYLRNNIEFNSKLRKIYRHY